jgi:hypothetical protein
MPNDLETIKEISQMAAGKCGEELYFRHEDIQHVLVLCTTNKIAVLGIEIFEVRPEGFVSKHFSVYDLNFRSVRPQGESEWADYVSASNGCAKEFLRENTIADEDVCILTTASWREFCELRT